MAICSPLNFSDARMRDRSAASLLASLRRNSAVLPGGSVLRTRAFLAAGFLVDGDGELGPAASVGALR
jgi:hypothetical protein